MATSISVVMSVFNGREYLQEQVLSVVSQLDPNDELIVIDDASVDESMDIVRAIDSPLIRLFRNESNLGVIGSFQRGLSLARQEVGFLCDQDDVWLPGKRAAFVGAFDSDPTATVVVSDAEIIDASGEIISRSFMSGRGGFNGSLPGTFWRSRYIGCAMAIRRSILNMALPIPARAPMHDIWLGVMGRIAGRVHYLPVPYVRYRRHSRNASTMMPNPPHIMIALRLALFTVLLQRMLAVKCGYWQDAIVPVNAAMDEAISLDRRHRIMGYT
jgi:glycosyltransferase involved in cell wall biosynthesis